MMSRRHLLSPSSPTTDLPIKPQRLPLPGLCQRPSVVAQNWSGRPKVDIGVSTEGWNVFARRWEVFHTGSGIDDASAPSQLFQCAGTELSDSLLKAATSDHLPQLLAAMRSLPVIPVATGALRIELLQLHQERNEPFGTFTARVHGKAETCAFAAECEWDTQPRHPARSTGNPRHPKDTG